MGVERWRKKETTDPFGLSFGRRHWLNCKDRMPKKKKNIFGQDYKL
jgi:hypothetical protein